MKNFFQVNDSPKKLCGSIVLDEFTVYIHMFLHIWEVLLIERERKPTEDVFNTITRIQSLCCFPLWDLLEGAVTNF